MVAIVVPAFQGCAPRYSDALLKDSQASFAANLQPTSGKLSAFRSPLEIARLDPAGVYRRVERVYKSNTTEFAWFKSTDRNADIVRSPVANDAFDRFYFTEAGRPPQAIDFNSILANNPSHNLGHPRPSLPPTMTVAGGGGTQQVIAYTYVTVSAWGEESPPAPPGLVTAFVNSTSITINISPATIPGGAPNRVPLSFIDIYRSQGGDVSSGAYFRVGRIDYGTWSFVDTMRDDEVSLQPMLDTFSNDAPFPNMQGLIQHSSGALVGFYERTVYFSRPYLPHAWPQDTLYVVKSPVVGLAAVSNSIIVMTKAHPVVLSGNTPDAIQIVNMTDYEPCVSKRSIVSTQNRAIYASPNGLIMVSAEGLQKLTNDILTRREWIRYEPHKLLADVYGSYYIGFTSENGGICIPIPPYEPVQLITLDRYAGITAVDNDERTGDLYITSGDIIMQFDGLDDRRFPTTWRSKEFIQKHPINFGAIQVLFSARPESPEQRAAREAAEEYNNAKFALGPLDTFDLYPIGDTGPVAALPSGFPPVLLPPPGNTLGGEPLYDLLQFGGVDQIRTTVIGDGIARYTKIIADGKVKKMPSGYKATRWYIELSGTAEVDRVLMAETGKELAEV